jgi:hypothetical protein
VEGFINTGDDAFVEYVLECVEVLAHKPTPHLTTECVRVHAHDDYVVKVFSGAIAFQHEKQDQSSAAPNLLTTYCRKGRSRKSLSERPAMEGV